MIEANKKCDEYPGWIQILLAIPSAVITLYLAMNIMIFSGIGLVYSGFSEGGFGFFSTIVYGTLTNIALIVLSCFFIIAVEDGRIKFSRIIFIACLEMFVIGVVGLGYKSGFSW